MKPGWVAAACFGAAWAGSTAGALLAVTVLAASGADRGGAGAFLAIVIAGGAGAVAAVVAAARMTGGLDPEASGLRLPRLRTGLAAVAVGVVAVVVLGALAAALGAFAEPTVPRELSAQTGYDRLSGAVDLTRVGVGPAAAASILARAVVALTLVDLLLRGVVLPALAAWLGRPGAVAITGLLLGAGAASVGSGLVLPGVLLALLCCWLLAETGSLLPGTVVLCAGAGAAMAAGLDWSPAAVAGTGVLCGLAAGALALPLVLLGARVPDGPTPAWDLRPRQG